MPIRYNSWNSWQNARSFTLDALALGTLSFRVPLPLVVSPPAIGVWLGLVAVIAVVASLVPARAAARLTVRESLAYV